MKISQPRVIIALARLIRYQCRLAITRRRVATTLPALDISAVQALMRVRDIEAMSVVYDLLVATGPGHRIPGDFPDCAVTSFLRRYYAACILENPCALRTDAHSRYAACWDAASLLRSAWRSTGAGIPDIGLAWVRDLYLSSDADIRLALETGLLEHIIGFKQAREAMRNGLDDPVLEVALERSGYC